MPNDAIDPAKDLRPVMFAGADWYELLSPTAPEPTAWYLARAPENEWWVQLLSAAFEFAVEHDLVEHYRKRFAGIRAVELTPARAFVEGRQVGFPIWAIANELVVARYLERVLGWTYLAMEPNGRGARRGDWLFRAPSGREVFVEVKSVAEPDRYTGDAAVHVGVWPDYRPRIRDVVKEGYKQLPDDERGTLIVLVGNEILGISHGIMHGALFSALFGQYQITFTAIPEFLPESMRAGPSFHDMLVQPGKHRRLGCVAALVVRGLDVPGVRFYPIHNPFAYKSVRTAADDFGDSNQFVFSESDGHEVDGVHPREAWERMKRID